MQGGSFCNFRIPPSPEDEGPCAFFPFSILFCSAAGSAGNFCPSMLPAEVISYMTAVSQSETRAEGLGKQFRNRLGPGNCVLKRALQIAQLGMIGVL